MTTDSGGNWSITGDYTCPAGAYVYVLALGGNPGLGGSVSNSRLALMAGLGACSSLLPTTQISIDEVTTVATVYSLAAFMSTETNVGSSSTNAIGIQNAFSNIPTLVNIASGQAYATTPAGNGTVPQAEINTLANALAPCINSDGSGTACAGLMAAANVSSTAGTPVDTVQGDDQHRPQPGHQRCHAVRSRHCERSVSAIADLRSERLHAAGGVHGRPQPGAGDCGRCRGNIYASTRSAPA